MLLLGVRVHRRFFLLVRLNTNGKEQFFLPRLRTLKSFLHRTIVAQLLSRLVGNPPRASRPIPHQGRLLSLKYGLPHLVCCRSSRLSLLALQIRALLNYIARLLRLLHLTHSDKIHLFQLQESDECRLLQRPRSTLLHCLMSSEHLINRGPLQALCHYAIHREVRWILLIRIVLSLLL